MSDPGVYAAAIGTVISAVTIAVVTIVNTIAAARDRSANRKARYEILEGQKSGAIETERIVKLVDGGLDEVKRQLAESNARNAVLVERLLTTTVTLPPERKNEP